MAQMSPFRANRLDDFRQASRSVWLSAHGSTSPVTCRSCSRKLREQFPFPDSGDPQSDVDNRIPEIEFCGDVTNVDHQPFTIGRDADLVIDDCRFLHRRFLSLSSRHGIWLLTNVGALLTAAVSDVGGKLEAFLAPGGVLPLVFDQTIVRFNAGPTSYEFSIRVPNATLEVVGIEENRSGVATVGRVGMTPDQLRLIIALAEPALSGTGSGRTSVPSATDVVLRLGWTKTRYNRKLDNVCEKLAAQGVRGLHGGPGRLASSRRVRLVEYALAVRLVTRADLVLLNAGHDPDASQTRCA
jgi:hypothetical protein